MFRPRRFGEPSSQGSNEPLKGFVPHPDPTKPPSPYLRYPNYDTRQPLGQRSIYHTDGRILAPSVSRDRYIEDIGSLSDAQLVEQGGSAGRLSYVPRCFTVGRRQCTQLRLPLFAWATRVCVCVCVYVCARAHTVPGVST